MCVCVCVCVCICVSARLRARLYGVCVPKCVRVHVRLRMQTCMHLCCVHSMRVCMCCHACVSACTVCACACMRACACGLLVTLEVANCYLPTLFWRLAWNASCCRWEVQHQRLHECGCSQWALWLAFLSHKLFSALDVAHTAMLPLPRNSYSSEMDVSPSRVTICPHTVLREFLLPGTLGHKILPDPQTGALRDWFS